jgi:hypothetical protein
MNNTEVLYRLEQARLEKFRQDAYLHSLLKQQRPSLRLRTARALRHLALRLYPEVETRSLSLQNTRH